MSKVPHRLVVIGHGAAGLTAAVAAAEAARSHDLAVEITLLEKAPQEAAGGNTLWSPSYMRLDASDRIAPNFEDAMREACDGHGDRLYFRTLAENATTTVAWLERHGVAFCAPLYYLSAGPRRIQPVGGGRALVGALSRAARGLGVAMRYECPAERIVRAGNGRVGGIVVSDTDGTRTIPADAVILASGGFQADGEMMRAHFGPGAEGFKLISPGTRHNSGDGIRMAIEQGARTSGDWNGMHAEPVDPRSKNSAPVVLVYPYGIVVDQNGRRFFDEGAGLVHETWERFARQIHFETPGRRAYAILDGRLFDIAGFERAIRSEVAPHRADTLEGLAGLIGIDPTVLMETVTTYNRAATGDPALFDASRRDGLAASAWLDPPKSNWARAIAMPPFLAYPLVGAIAYTFGGLATNEKAEVLGTDGPLPGLYAAGEGTTFNILRGLDWAADQGARVVNMSFAGPSDPALHDALVKANKKGMVLIAAAGNAGPNSPPLYPGADPNVIAVTATDSRDALFPGANRGNYIAVAAPGVDVFAPAPEGTYQLTTGTSVAAAEVSGVAALLIERNPALTPAAVRKILMDTAFHLGPKGRNRDFGTGLVNALDAVNAAKPK